MAIFAICGIVAMLVAILLFNPIGISNKSAKKRKTTSITLVLIASVSLTACSGDRHRHVYRNLQDCVDDWGSAVQCQAIDDYSHPYGYYWGPYYETRNGGIYYYHSSSGGQAYRVPGNAGILKSRNFNSTKSVGRVSRGGFGSSGKSFGSSGS